MFCVSSSALSAYDCSFEKGLCVWMQGAEDELDWFLMSGPTETPNTGPAGDHTTSKGQCGPEKSIVKKCPNSIVMMKAMLFVVQQEGTFTSTVFFHILRAKWPN